MASKKTELQKILLIFCVLNKFILIRFAFLEKFQEILIYSIITTMVVLVGLYASKKHLRKSILITLMLVNVANCFISAAYIVERAIVFYPYNSIQSFEVVSNVETYEEVQIDNYYGWMHKSGDGQKPLIIYFAGNGNSAAEMFDLKDLLNTWRYLDGYHFLIIDYPGYGKSKGVPTQNTMFAMAEQAYDYALSRDDVDTDNIYIMGYGVGTSVATYLASLHEMKGLVLFAPYDELRSVYNDALPIFYGPVRLLTRFRFESYKYAEKVKVKPLVIASSEDERISQRVTERILPYFSEGVEFAVYDDLGHEDFWLDSDVLERIEEYLQKGM